MFQIANFSQRKTGNDKKSSNVWSMSLGIKITCILKIEPYNLPYQLYKEFFIIIALNNVILYML